MTGAYDDALYTDDALAEQLAGDLWRQLWGYTRPYRGSGDSAPAPWWSLMDVAFPSIPVKWLTPSEKAAPRRT